MAASEKTVKLPMEQLIQVVQLQLSESGKASLIVTGGSMLPMLRPIKDRVLLAPPEKYAKGDIILYRRENGQYVLHRILQKKKGYCICSGDNQYEKERVDDAWVLAVVTDFYKLSKKYSVTGKWYRLYKWSWVTLFPIRRVLLRMVRVTYRLKNKLRGDKL